MTYRPLLIGFVICSLGLTLTGCGGKTTSSEPGTVLDEAKRAGRTAESFPAADEDYFREMDKGVRLTPDEVKGRNMWLVWTGGNDRLWDYLASHSFGALDFLKTLSSHPSMKHVSRDNRWQYLGVVNEPCFEKATGPRADRYGLWFDTRRQDCPPEPFENEQKYPGVKIGARGKNIPVGSYYGYATGIVGLRLFPNPDFDEKAAKKWNPERFYTDPNYYLDADLIRPYRVGMSCGFCHVGPSPVQPPANPERPQWSNLHSNPGTQYFWVDRVFFWDRDEANFIFQLFHTSLPGTLDTSLISTDSINNPRTMNAVYSIGARLGPALLWGKEKLAGGNLKNKQLNDSPRTASFSQFFQAPDTVWTPRVLKDGADSVGILGALNRVYLNIGLFSEEWLLHFNPLVGGKKITPIKIEDAEKNSSYWNATTAQTPDMALFFVKTATPDLLKDAPGGQAYLTDDQEKLARGKVAFAEYCARCHSSKIPQAPAHVDTSDWGQYWAWTKTEDFKHKMQEMVLADDFLTDNFLSTERRIPVTLLQTHACSPLATNAIAGNIWDNFSSQTYKDLPSVGTITVHNPIDGTPWQYTLPGGGRGFTRPPSLLRVWSTAPLLLNNSMGKFSWEPSVVARMASFNDAIEQLLWPEKRTSDPSWKAEHMRQYFQRLENCQHRPVYRWLHKLFGVNPTRHGFQGWLTTEKALPLTVLGDRTLMEVIFAAALGVLEKSQYPLQRFLWMLQSQADPNDWRLVQTNALGVRYLPLATRHHARLGSRERLLDVAQRYPERLRIELDALATRVLFDSENRAIGVEYLKDKRLYRAHAHPSGEPGELRQVFATRETILCGGAFNTPQLLMLSGIGPRQELERHGIAVRVDLPGVGTNLQDRYEVGVVNRMREDWKVMAGAHFATGDRQYQQWAARRKGVYTTNGGLLGVINKSDTAPLLPDLFFLALMGQFRGYFPGYAQLLPQHHNYLTWVVLKAHTRNTAGIVTLRSADPRDTPCISFNFFPEDNEAARADLEAVVSGIEFVRAMTAQVHPYIAEEELPGKDIHSREHLRQFVKDNAWGHHASCTCAIGAREKNGVVNSKFEVHGTKNLRIVDASVFPRIPGFFIVSAVYMIGEKASDVILARG